MFTNPLTARFAVALLFLISASALAVPTLPRPLEDVTKLEKPTICFEGWSGWGLYLIDWDGQNQRLWMSDKARFAGAPAWRSDGKRVAIAMFTEANWSYTTFILDLQTRQVENLTAKTPKDLVHASVVWSPDGRWIGYTGYYEDSPENFDVFKQNVGSGKVVNLTNSPKHHDSQPSWSPDGKKVVFSSRRDREETSDSEDFIYIMDVDGKNEVQLTDDYPASDSYPQWSPDGKKIAFLSYGRTGPYRIDLYLMDPDGSNIERLTFDELQKSSAGWSPDGKWLIYNMRTERGKPHDVFRVNVETKEVVQVTFDVGVHSPRWVLAGKSRFLSVDPAGKKKAQWGRIKETGGSENSSDEAKFLFE